MTSNKLNINTVADQLIAARKIWEDGTYKSSNDELYKLLASCLDFYIAVAGDCNLSEPLNALLKSRGFTVTNGTSSALKVVRLVFGDAAQPKRFENRLATYARVLSVAKAQKQTAATLANFIVENGGIDEIRRNGTSSSSKVEAAKKQREKAAFVYSTNEQTPLFKLPMLPKQLEPAEGERYSLALVRKNADGTGSIVFGTGNKTVLDGVLKLAGKEIEDGFIQKVKQQQDDADEKRREQNMKELQKLLVQKNKSFTAEVTLPEEIVLEAEPA